METTTDDAEVTGGDHDRQRGLVDDADHSDDASLVKQAKRDEEHHHHHSFFHKNNEHHEHKQEHEHHQQHSSPEHEHHQQHSLKEKKKKKKEEDGKVYGASHKVVHLRAHSHDFGVSNVVKHGAPVVDPLPSSSSPKSESNAVTDEAEGKSSDAARVASLPNLTSDNSVRKSDSPTSTSSSSSSLVSRNNKPKTQQQMFESLVRWLQTVKGYLYLRIDTIGLQPQPSGDSKSHGQQQQQQHDENDSKKKEKTKKQQHHENTSFIFPLEGDSTKTTTATTTTATTTHPQQQSQAVPLNSISEPYNLVQPTPRELKHIIDMIIDTVISTHIETLYRTTSTQVDNRPFEFASIAFLSRELLSLCLQTLSLPVISSFLLSYLTLTWHSSSSSSIISLLFDSRDSSKAKWKRLWCALRGAAILCFSDAPPKGEETAFVESTDKYSELSLASAAGRIMFII